MQWYNTLLIIFIERVLNSTLFLCLRNPPAIKAKGIHQSMSRKGKCLDNVVMENFFGLLKSELCICRISIPWPGKSTTSWLKIKSFVEDVYVTCRYILKADGISSIVVAQPGQIGELVYLLV